MLNTAPRDQIFIKVVCICLGHGLRTADHDHNKTLNHSPLLVECVKRPRDIETNT
jgi:hypothetical protein